MCFGALHGIKKVLRVTKPLNVLDDGCGRRGAGSLLTAAN